MFCQFRTYFEISFGNKFVGNLCYDASDDSGVEQHDVGDPEHAEDEWAHEDGEVGAPDGRGQVSPGVEAGNVADVDAGKLVLQDPGQVPDFFTELWL